MRSTLAWPAVPGLRMRIARCTCPPYVRPHNPLPCFEKSVGGLGFRRGPRRCPTQLHPGFVTGSEMASERPTEGGAEACSQVPLGGTEVDRSDRALMERVYGGHAPSLRILLQRHWSTLVSYAIEFLDDADLAEDVVQTAFIRIWNGRAKGPPPTAVRSYLYRATRNLSLNVRRDLGRRSKREGDYPARPSFGSQTPQDLLEEEIVRQEVERAISRLPPRQREVFVLSRFHSLSHREIAETLGTSPQTVANQVAAALDSLRKQLAHHLATW